MSGLLWTDASKARDKFWSFVRDIMSVEFMSDFKLKPSLEQVLSHWTNMSGAGRALLSSQKTKETFD